MHRHGYQLSSQAIPSLSVLRLDRLQDRRPHLQQVTGRGRPLDSRVNRLKRINDFQGWRRRADSNRCVTVLQTVPLAAWVRRLSTRNKSRFQKERGRSSLWRILRYCGSAQRSSVAKPPSQRSLSYGTKQFMPLLENVQEASLAERVGFEPAVRLPRQQALMKPLRFGLAFAPLRFERVWKARGRC